MARIDFDPDEDDVDNVDIDNITLEDTELETLVYEYIDDNPEFVSKYIGENRILLNSLTVESLMIEPCRESKNTMKKLLGLRDCASDADIIREFSDFISKCN